MVPATDGQRISDLLLRSVAIGNINDTMNEAMVDATREDPITLLKRKVIPMMLSSK